MNDSRSLLLPPYARTIGIAIDHRDGDMPVLAMDFSSNLCGHPGMFHGGALGGLIGLAAQVRVDEHIAASGGNGHARSLGITLSYLRAAGPQRLYAGAMILRVGRRLANMQVQAWQDDRAKPVATAFINFALNG